MPELSSIDLIFLFIVVCFYILFLFQIALLLFGSFERLSKSIKIILNISLMKKEITIYNKKQLNAKTISSLKEICTEREIKLPETKKFKKEIC